MDETSFEVIMALDFYGQVITRCWKSRNICFNKTILLISLDVGRGEFIRFPIKTLISRHNAKLTETNALGVYN